jgi:LacI family transcriptional regulator
MKDKVVTLKEIARIANVSAMTVSRALNDSSYVQQETKEKIRRLAKELNYRPNRMARSLVLNRSHLLGLIVSNIRNQFFAELARGI